MILYLQVISSLLGIGVSLGTLLFVTLPKGRDMLLNFLTRDNKLKQEISSVSQMLREHTSEDGKKKEEARLQKEVDRCVLRSLITSIYYCYAKEKKIPVYAMEDVAALYELYKKRGGNSYVQSLMRQILEEWEVIS